MEKAQAELLKAAQLAWDSSAGWVKQAGASSENCPSPKGHLWALPCPQCDVEIHGREKSAFAVFPRTSGPTFSGNRDERTK